MYVYILSVLFLWRTLTNREFVWIRWKHSTSDLEKVAHLDRSLKQANRVPSNC